MNVSPKILRQSLSRRSLGRFAKAVMPAYEIDPCHELMIARVEDLLAGKIKKLAIITPPRHGKTTLGNVAAPAFALGRNPTETVITVSYGSELSEGFGRRVRNILSDPAFHEVFPACQLSPDSAAAYRFTTTLGGEYSAVGRGGPVTGRGASLLVLDDLIKDSSEANSDTVCQSIVEWLQHVAFTRLTPNGRVLAIATRWSERDPMGWILQQQGWTVLHLPALAESAKDPLGREIGEALWPSHYPVEALEAIRVDVGPRVFQTLYQGNVSASQGTIFKRDWFRHYQQPPETFSRIVQSWDTAFKTGATNDYSVCATFGETKNGFYLLALYRAKVEFPELKRQVALQADLWHPSEIYVEDKASGQSLIQEIKTSTSVPVIAVKTDRDKETRASVVTGYFESGRVFFPESAAWLADLEDELASFPGGLHDDCVDAVCQALNRLRDSGGSLTWVDYIKDVASGRKKPFARTQRAFQSEERRLRRMGEITGAVNQQAVNTNEPAAPTTCPLCGNNVLERTGNKFKCTRCLKYCDGAAVDETKCPKCGGNSTVIGRGERRCQNCAFQFFPDGVPPKPKPFNRRNWPPPEPPFRGIFGRFG